MLGTKCFLTISKEFLGHMSCVLLFFEVHAMKFFESIPSKFLSKFKVSLKDVRKRIKSYLLFTFEVGKVWKCCRLDENWGFKGTQRSLSIMFDINNSCQFKFKLLRVAKHLFYGDCSFQNQNLIWHFWLQTWLSNKDLSWRCQQKFCKKKPNKQSCKTHLWSRLPFVVNFENRYYFFKRFSEFLQNLKRTANKYWSTRC